MVHRQDICGLRAIAVMPVILHHAGLGLVSGGFLGVDVFFVISGFLITGIVLRDLEAGRFSLGQFYIRRARRLLPALFAVLLVTTLLALLVLPPVAFRDFGQSLLATALFASNLLFWMESGYFDTAAQLKPLLHTWSLAVEEQFYLLFPPLLMLLWSARGRLLAVVAVLLLFSLGLAQWGVSAMPAAAFYLAPFRAWELLCGAVLAIVLAGRAQPVNGAVALAGLGAICAAMLVFDHTTPTPSLFTLVPVMGTCAVLACSGPGTWVARLLGLRPLVWIGLISYSAYLWHQPLFALARMQLHYEPALWVMLGLSALTLVLAAATWAWVEQPFRGTAHRSARWMARPATLGRACALGLALMAATGLWAHLSHGRPDLWLSMLTPDKRALQVSISTERQIAQHTGTQPIIRGPCVFAVKTLDSASRARLLDCHARHGPGLLIFGDSHATDTFLMATAEAATHDRFITAIAAGGCRPFAARAECAYDALLDLAATTPGLWHDAIYAQAGFHLLQTAQGGAVSRKTFDIPLHHTVPALPPDAGRVGRVLAYLEQLDRHVTVTWLGPRLEHHIPLDLIRARGCKDDIGLRPGQRAVFEQLDSALHQAARAHQIGYLSSIKTLRTRFPADLMSCADVFWSDGDHFSTPGEARFGKRLNLAARFAAPATPARVSLGFGTADLPPS